MFLLSYRTKLDEWIIFVVDLRGCSSERYEITVEISVGFSKIPTRKLFLSLAVLLITP